MNNNIAMPGSTGVVPSDLRPLIHEIRGVQVMLDRDLAGLYGVPTKVLNQAVKRNAERFPDRFMFRLAESEMNELVTNCDRFEKLKHSSAAMCAFTEQGIAMLSSVLRSAIAIQVSIQIMDAFVAMRRVLVSRLRCCLGLKPLSAAKSRISRVTRLASI